MKIGVVFPQHEIGPDATVARDFAVMVEELGYDHLLLYEHVAGADPTRHTLAGAYTHETDFHEPYVMFGHVAALTSSIGLWFGVLVLPQRQTVLVAKQTATLDILSGGRVTLGVGVGWNQVEYEILGQDFSTRGRRMEEQIPLLRRLWHEPLVDFEGEFDRILGASIKPRPDRSIPIWIGGWADRVLRRIGRIGDGWLAWPSTTLANTEAIFGPADLPRRWEIVADEARKAGRDPSEIGRAVAIGVIGTGETWEPAAMAVRAREWEAAGATHGSIGTVWAGFETRQQHFDAIIRFREEYG